MCKFVGSRIYTSLVLKVKEKPETSTFITKLSAVQSQSITQCWSCCTHNWNIFSRRTVTVHQLTQYRNWSIILFSCDETWHLVALKCIRDNEFPSPIFPQWAGLTDAWGGGVTRHGVLGVRIFSFSYRERCCHACALLTNEKYKVDDYFSFVSALSLMIQRCLSGTQRLVPAHYYCFPHFWKIICFLCK